MGDYSDCEDERDEMFWRSWDSGAAMSGDSATRGSRAAQCAADSLAAHLIDATSSGYGNERPLVLEMVAWALLGYARELRVERLSRSLDELLADFDKEPR